MAKKTPSPKARPYGRQADGKTIKSLSLEAEVASWAEKEAAKRGMSFSSFVNDFLKGNIKLILFLALLAKLTHSPTDWSGEAVATAACTGCVWFGQGVAWLVSGAWQVGGALLTSL